MINKLLHPHQNKHAISIIRSIKRYGSALDGSDTGTGKTYVSLAIAKYLNLIPIILVPLSAINSWEKVANLFEINIFIHNYEQFQRGNPRHITKIERKYKDSFNTSYKWNTSSKHLIIFDESHRCANHSTLNSKILRATLGTNSKVLALSATLAEDPTQMYSVGLVLKLFHNWPTYVRWGLKRGMGKGWPKGYRFKKKNRELNLCKINDDLYPSRGSRMRIADIEGFPENLIITEAYNMNGAKIIQELYDEMKDTMQLTKRLLTRAKIEQFKLDTILEMTNDLLDEGKSVIIFVNFKDSINCLSRKLKTKCIIDGSTTGNVRTKNIEDFQTNRSKVIICNNKAGGISINLHDIHGGHPRVSLISPPESARDLIQVFGRSHRDGTKSKTIQKIIWCANTVEEEMASNLNQKIGNIHIINDGDLADPRMVNLFDAKG